MRIRVSCEDGYEAQKLAGLIYRDRGRETCITKILNIVGGEVVIAVRDGSAHSIMFKDGGNADRFADFVQSVLEHRHRIVGTAASAGDVEITKG